MSTLTKAEISQLIAKNSLLALAPDIDDDISAALIGQCPDIFSDFKINTINRIAHFFAQILKETGGLGRLDENLHYTTAARLVAIFPSKFANEGAARPYLRNPEKLGNFVYATKNGNHLPGDGYRYRGSGLIQLTGRGNFKSVGELIGVGTALETNPDDVRQPDRAVLIAVGFWTAREINDVADGADDAAVDAVTRLVNRYENAAGRRERRRNFKKAREIFTDAARSNLRTARAGYALTEAVAEVDAEEREAEFSTEPSPLEILADQQRDFQALPWTRATIAAVPPVYWPRLDVNAPDYHHVHTLATDEAAEGSFSLNAAVIELLLKANDFAIPAGQKLVTLALRGAALPGRHEAVGQATVECLDVRPDHINFRCLIGFYDTVGKTITLFSASTVPAPKYMKNYYFKKNGLPYTMEVDCNMLPTGCYVFRVGSHDGDNVKPALRMSEIDDLDTDAKVCVLRTSNDLAFGLADDLDPPRRVYDNVHCSYVTNHSTNFEASFSSAGCLTVRGRNAPSTEQWAKFQAVLTRIGTGNRTDLVLLTGKEAALAAEIVAGGGPVAAEEFRRLRPGSTGERVKKLQAKLDIAQSGYFGPSTKKKLHQAQVANGHPSDGVYSPALDRITGWAVF